MIGNGIKNVIWIYEESNWNIEKNFDCLVQSNKKGNWDLFYLVDMWKGIKTKILKIPKTPH